MQRLTSFSEWEGSPQLNHSSFTPACANTLLATACDSRMSNGEKPASLNTETVTVVTSGCGFFETAEGVKKAKMSAARTPPRSDLGFTVIASIPQAYRRSATSAFVNMTKVLPVCSPKWPPYPGFIEASNCWEETLDLETFRP
jgi:hypothetical protein